MKNNKLALRHILEHVLKGVFWLLPIVAITVIILWLYSKVGKIIDLIFSLVGFEPEQYIFLWMTLVILIITSLLYFIGLFMDTKLADFFQKIFAKIPGYSTIHDVVNIFNSSKKGETKVLVVAIQGFGSNSYNIGLMYSTKESIIKDHYTITLSQSPIPNGGFMFEVHKDDIFVIENATFDNNLQYLLSMGVKSLADIIKIKPKSIEELTPFSIWLERTK